MTTDRTSAAINRKLHWHGARDMELPNGTHLMPWHFISDGDHLLDYAAHEDHRYGVWITGDFWCCGCVARPPAHFTKDGHPAWPSMHRAPNGLVVAIAHEDDIDPDRRFVRRPLCPFGNGSGTPAHEDALDVAIDDHMQAELGALTETPRGLASGSSPEVPS